MKKNKKGMVPDLTEFTDLDGNRWVQTSADDLFSSKELNDILEAIEKDKDTEEIVLARIDFKKVNKEYYETVIDLQSKLNKQNESLKKLLINAKETIDKKNNKLKELINYIRKLHLLLAYYEMDPEEVKKIRALPEKLLYEPEIDDKKIKKDIEEDRNMVNMVIEEKDVEYTEVEEILLNEDGEEMGTVHR